MPAEKGQSNGAVSSLEGYPKLSAFLSSFPETALFRKFGALNIQNLLYLQAELSELEVELREIAKEDSQSGDSERVLFNKDWWELSQASEKAGNNLQWIKVLETREKLKVYNNALLQQVELFKLGRPSRHNLEVIRKWLQWPEYGNFFLRGAEAQVWEDVNATDLVALCDSQHEQDIFSRWYHDRLLAYFHQCLGYRFRKPIAHDIEGGLTEYKDSTVSAVARTISITLAAMLPSVSIFVLYFVTNVLARLGIITAFSGAFSITLAVFTKARKVEIFAATAA
ncbi:MAG: hypothetical protein M1830_006055 [Pleopsidium flavum]|nr:MAG: hypothetical protein M1830_006055 [Pleopsidium flavum]